MKGRRRTVALIGAPGAGKSTVSLALREADPQARSFAVRLFYQSLQRQGSTVAAQIDAALAHARLIPDRLVEEMFQMFMQPVQSDAIVLLEGFPINEGQRHAAERQLAAKGRQVDGVIYLNAPRETLARRIASRLVCPRCEKINRAGVPVPIGHEYCPRCGGSLERRRDDNDDHFAFRYTEHLKDIQAIVRGFASVSLAEIDARQPYEQVMSEVWTFLDRPE